jgi:hypothetical protein
MLDIIQALVCDEKIYVVGEEIPTLKSLISNSTGGNKRLYELRLDVVAKIISRRNSKEL